MTIRSIVAKFNDIKPTSRSINSLFIPDLPAVLSVEYLVVAGGGGGGRPGGAGGGGGGGAGSSASAVAGTAGTENFGGGGGGSNADGATRVGGSGGSGIVILKYPSTVIATFSGGVTQTTATSGGFKVSTITATSTVNETVTFS